MTFKALDKRYSEMEYRKCGASGLKLPLISFCLLYTSPSPRDVEESRMPSSA